MRNCALLFNPYPAESESDKQFATSIEPGQPAHPCNLTMLYTIYLQILILISLNDNELFENGRQTIILADQNFMKMQIIYFRGISANIQTEKK